MLRLLCLARYGSSLIIAFVIIIIRLGVNVLEQIRSGCTSFSSLCTVVVVSVDAAAAVFFSQFSMFCALLDVGGMENITW